MSDTLDRLKRLCAAGEPTTVELEGLTFTIRPMRASGFCAMQAPYAMPGKGVTRTRAYQESQLAVVRDCVVAPSLDEISDDDLLNMPSKLFGELVNACLENSDVATADLEEMAKNSEATPGDGSPTA